MTKRGPGPAPIQIQAQFLRDHPVSAPAGPLSGFAVTLDQESPVLPVEASACRNASWQEADVKRAIAAAEEAGLRSYRVEMASDGTVSIIVGP